MTRLEDFINRPLPFLGRPVLSLNRGPRARASGDVRPGVTYRRNVKRNWVEIAKVLRVACDAQGIEHVTYDLTIERKKVNARPSAERRVLSLSSFRELYREPVQA